MKLTPLLEGTLQRTIIIVKAHKDKLQPIGQSHYRLNIMHSYKLRRPLIRGISVVERKICSMSAKGKKEVVGVVNVSGKPITQFKITHDHRKEKKNRFYCKHNVKEKQYKK